MNITIDEKKTSPAPDYPRMKISDQGRIVLFTKPDTGICLYDPTGAWKVGHVMEAWAEKLSFRPFFGTITISN